MQLDLKLHHYQAYCAGEVHGHFTNPAAAASFLLFRYSDSPLPMEIRDTLKNHLIPKSSFRSILAEAANTNRERALRQIYAL